MQPLLTWKQHSSPEGLLKAGLTRDFATAVAESLLAARPQLLLRP